MDSRTTIASNGNGLDVFNWYIVGELFIVVGSITVESVNFAKYD